MIQKQRFGVGRGLAAVLAEASGFPDDTSEFEASHLWRQNR